MLKILLFTLLIFALGCGQTPYGASLISRVRDRGPILTSENNPYLVGNLFLTQESQESAELKGFIEKRGNPSSIEVTEGFFGGMQMKLYYQDKSEHYECEKDGSIWLINGPLGSRKKHQAIEIPTSLPTIAPTSLPTARGFISQLTSPTPTRIPPPKFSPKTQALKNKSHPQVSEELAIKALALKYQGPQAEMAPKGDLVHYVNLSGETLAILARWYTFNKDNAAAIGRINGFPDPNRLTLGSTVIIPKYMIKNSTRLSAQALAEVNKLAADAPQ